MFRQLRDWTNSGEAERFVLAPIDLDDERPLPGPERCGTCGRRLLVRLGAITLDEPAGRQV